MRGRGGRGSAAVLTAALAVSLAAPLAGCSGSSDEPEEPATSATSGTASTSAASAYPTGVPSGITFTDPGTELTFAQDATVAWQPRQGLVGTLRLRVERVVRTTFAKSFQDWKVDAKTRTYTPYFVRGHVTNVGDTDLGGVRVPLYGESAANKLIEPASFKETFKPCHPSALPKPFAAGASASVCLVYLVPDHGELVGAAFRPTEEFEDPIVWTGTVATIAPAPTASPSTKAKPKKPKASPSAAG